MNKVELIEKVTELVAPKMFEEDAPKNVKVSKKLTAYFVNSVFEAIHNELANGGKVQISGFGSFEVTERAERVGRNPQTGEDMIIEAMKAPKFRAGSTLKAAVRGK